MTTSDTMPEIDPARMSSHTYRICNKTSFVKCCNYNWLHPIGDANWIDWDFICDWTFFFLGTCVREFEEPTDRKIYPKPSAQLSSAHLFCPVSTHAAGWLFSIVDRNRWFNLTLPGGGVDPKIYHIHPPECCLAESAKSVRGECVCGCVYVWEIVDWALSHWLPRLWLWRRRWRENPINEEKCPSSTIGWVG